MFTSFDQLTIGTTFFQKRTWSGFVEFTVAGKTGDELAIESVSHTGFNFMLSRQRFQQYQHVRQFMFASREEAVAHAKQQVEQAVTKHVDRFANDKEGFVKSLVQQVYADNANPDYGGCDTIVAEATKRLAAIHFPELTLHQ